MDKERVPGKVELNTQEIGKIINKRAMECILMLINLCMMESFKMAKDTDKVRCILMLINLCMMEIGKITKYMDKERKPGKMEKNTQEIGKMGNLLIIFDIENR